MESFVDSRQAAAILKLRKLMQTGGWQSVDANDGRFHLETVDKVMNLLFVHFSTVAMLLYFAYSNSSFKHSGTQLITFVSKTFQSMKKN